MFKVNNGYHIRNIHTSLVIMHSHIMVFEKKQKKDSNVFFFFFFFIWYKPHYCSTNIFFSSWTSKVCPTYQWWPCGSFFGWQRSLNFPGTEVIVDRTSKSVLDTFGHLCPIWPLWHSNIFFEFGPRKYVQPINDDLAVLFLAGIEVSTFREREIQSTEHPNPSWTTIRSSMSDMSPYVIWIFVYIYHVCITHDSWSESRTEQKFGSDRVQNSSRTPPTIHPNIRTQYQIHRSSIQYDPLWAFKYFFRVWTSETYLTYWVWHAEHFSRWHEVTISTGTLTFNIFFFFFFFVNFFGHKLFFWS